MMYVFPYSEGIIELIVKICVLILAVLLYLTITAAPVA
jgi:hypothetical protein